MNTQTPIPMVDLKQQHHVLREELDEAVSRVVSSNAYIGGPAVTEFADAFSGFCGVRHAIPCANGTEALRAAIVSVLGEGDGVQEIVTVSHTFAATVEAIVMARYRPVLVDVSSSTYLMDLDQAEAACTDRTVAIVPVHLYGQMVDMRRLGVISDRKGLAIIEDAAQAHGASFEKVRPGQLSSAASFSFYPGKNLGAWGDAGAVITNNDATAEAVAQLIDHGRSDKFTHQTVGINARMDSIQAAVLNVKLRHLDDWNLARRKAAGWYGDSLAERDDLMLPAVAQGARHVYHQYVVQVSDRTAVQATLGEANIASGVHYPIPVHEQPAYQYLGLKPESLPQTHQLCRSILSLPMFPGITREQCTRVAKGLRMSMAMECRMSNSE